jgi:hypothetical protein
MHCDEAAIDNGSHVVPTTDQLVCGRRDPRFDPAAAGWRRRDPRRREHPDPQPPSADPARWQVVMAPLDERHDKISRVAGVDRPLRRPITASRGCRHTRSGSSDRWSSGPATGCGVGCASDPPPRVKASKGPGLAPPSLIFLREPRGKARKGGERPEMSVRRRWRIAWVRRSLGSPACRAVVLPRARLAG